MLTERHVQAIWYDADLRPAELRAAGGRLVRVVDPGHWNLEAGPDFRRAVLEVGGTARRLVGDVEVHIHPRDWFAHGHHLDPAYADVVAHVTWYPQTEEFPADAPGPRPLPICLGAVLRTRTDFSPDEIDVTAYPYAKLPATPRPCEAVFANRTDDLLAFLRAAGRARLWQKARRLKARLVRGNGRAQTFYEEVLGAFGYKYNAAPFRALASVVPFDALPPGAEAVTYSLACAVEMRVLPEIPWHRANTRPVNSPARRLAAAGALFGQGGALQARLDACSLASYEGCRTAVGILCESRLLGARRAAAILANVLVPFALAEGRLREVPDRLPPEDVSQPVRLTANRLLGRDHNPALYAGNGLLIQGLLHVHRTYCLAVHPDCSGCAVRSDRIDNNRVQSAAIGCNRIDSNRRQSSAIDSNRRKAPNDRNP